jgi:hypothetical protein
MSETMTGKDLLIDLLKHIHTTLHRTMDGLCNEIFEWQPDEGANNIRLTIWHISRSFDVLKTRILDGQNPELELWHVNGWKRKTEYDPRGIGFAGLGNLTGYNLAEVNAVPSMSTKESLLYFDECWQALLNFLITLPETELMNQVIFEGVSFPAYEFFRGFLMDAYEHLGEIKAIKAIYDLVFAQTGAISTF